MRQHTPLSRSLLVLDDETEAEHEPIPEATGARMIAGVQILLLVTFNWCTVLRREQGGRAGQLDSGSHSKEGCRKRIHAQNNLFSDSNRQQ